MTLFLSCAISSIRVYLFFASSSIEQNRFDCEKFQNTQKWSRKLHTTSYHDATMYRRRYISWHFNRKSANYFVHMTIFVVYIFHCLVRVRVWACMRSLITLFRMYKFNRANFSENHHGNIHIHIYITIINQRQNGKNLSPLISFPMIYSLKIYYVISVVLIENKLYRKVWFLL